jgi:hypothetical protein
MQQNSTTATYAMVMACFDAFLMRLRHAMRSLGALTVDQTMGIDFADYAHLHTLAGTIGVYMTCTTWRELCIQQVSEGDACMQPHAAWAFLFAACHGTCLT